MATTAGSARRAAARSLIAGGGAPGSGIAADGAMLEPVAVGTQQERAQVLAVEGVLRVELERSLLGAHRPEEVAVQHVDVGEVLVGQRGARVLVASDGDGEHRQGGLAL